ncbi:hypothetical protein ABEB36_010905 [Hypothenemus hampei]|uniref:Latrophilin Cirl n=2 Tax=Hypothenemus hampei TaxID=57062 RepID=A0ABD1EHQ4_HYPHA
MAWHGKIRPGLLLLLFSFVVISEATAKALEQYRYETAYACEGKTLKIECKDGELIKLIRANYGRFSITICNDHGNTDWSVNCMSPKSLRVLHARCTHYQNCSIPAITSMFGDPCPGTHKYLEAHYQCLPATTTTTTSRPSPPWLITSQPPMWSTIKTPSARPSTTKVTISPPSPIPGPIPSSTFVNNIPTSTSKGFHEVPDSIPNKKKDQNQNEWNWEPKEPNQYDFTTLPLTTIMPKGNPNKRLPTSDSTTYSYSPSVPSVYPWPKDSEFLPHHCNATTIRNIYWKSTHFNETAVQPCPPGTTGFAKWNCSENSLSTYAEWTPEHPDLSECRSVWLTSLEQRLLLGKDLLMSIIRDLSTVTGSKTLYGGDMAITTKIIRKMTEKMAHDISTFPDLRQREEIATEMLEYVTKTSSNLLDATQYSSWKDLNFKDQMSVATSLLIGLEENAFVLAGTVTSQKTVENKEKNILLSVRILDTKLLSDEAFPSEERSSDWKGSNDSIELPKEALLENNDGNFVKLVFVAFDRLEEILQWKPDNSDNENNITKILNSKVISASLGQGRHIQLKEPVKLTLKHIKTENVSNPRCVFWDYTTNSWSEEGCRVDTSYSNYTHTVCYCDHLTNFAILMDVHDVYLPIPHEIALQVITYIGCIVSIICLILAIVTFQLFRGLKSDRTTIHCNLCTCLLIAEFIFLIGINRTENRIVCGVIAAFLQYLFLCAFIWMFFEGFQLYVMLIEVFEVEKSRLRWYYIFAYGLPFLIVFASGTVYPQGYGTIRHCWLKTDNYFIYTFVVPVLIVMLLNVIFLTMAIVMMCRHASASVSMKNKEHSRLASTRAWLKGAFVLVFLLGLTWIFGFFYINQESVAMAYLFATFNSFQGFFIFLFHCVQNEKVRKEYRKFIRRHSWLPKCLRCSKSSGGTAGSSSGTSGSCTTSGGVSKERRPSLYGSNGNPSGGTASHSTDNSVLTPHGTSVGTNSNNSIVISNNLNNARPTALVQILSRTDLNNASTTMTNHNRQQVATRLELPELYERESSMPHTCTHFYIGQHGCYSVSPPSYHRFRSFSRSRSP